MFREVKCPRTHGLGKHFEGEVQNNVCVEANDLFPTKTTCLFDLFGDLGR